MFTGIVTDVGRLVAADDRNDGRLLRIATDYEPEGIDLGASITVDGICLTVTDKGRARHQLVRGLRRARNPRRHRSRQVAGRPPHQSRALAQDRRRARRPHRLRPHRRHGDDRRQGRDRRPDHLHLRGRARASRCSSRKKGSVALNGTSLTVNEVDGNRFSVHLIPYTVEVTSWGDYDVGDRVNIEVDPMARYAARHVRSAR